MVGAHNALQAMPPLLFISKANNCFLHPFMQLLRSAGSSTGISMYQTEQYTCRQLMVLYISASWGLTCNSLRKNKKIFTICSNSEKLKRSTSPGAMVMMGVLLWQLPLNPYWIYMTSFLSVESFQWFFSWNIWLPDPLAIKQTRITDVTAEAAACANRSTLVLLCLTSLLLGRWNLTQLWSCALKEVLRQSVRTSCLDFKYSIKVPQQYSCFYFSCIIDPCKKKNLCREQWSPSSKRYQWVKSVLLNTSAFQNQTVCLFFIACCVFFFSVIQYK